MIKTSLKVLGHAAFTGFGFILSVMAVGAGVYNPIYYCCFLYNGISDILGKEKS